MFTARDTIAAIATPPGRGGVGIVRVSGGAVERIAAAVLKAPLKLRHAHYRSFLDHDGSIIDQGLAVLFPAPQSYTGEPVLELQGHGGPVVLDLLLRRVLHLGARLARPGEFTERAFLNGRIDLAQAEAVADLIDSSTAEAARSAQRSLQGDFSRNIHELVEHLIRLRQFVEAAIDFAEEDIDFLAEGEVGGKLQELVAQLNGIAATARQGSLLREGMNLVIAGPPNAGKSSLLNRLAGREAAIVTEVPGTTRDLLREHIQIDGMPLHIIDTAGLRDSEDRVEQEGIRRAREAIAGADRVLLVLDDRYPEEGDALPGDWPESPPLTRIHNKIDLTGRTPAIETLGAATSVYLSAKSGAGLPLLRDHLKACMGYHAGESGVFMARRRHLEALGQAGACLARAQGQFAAGRGELLAEDLRQAQNALSEITGEFTSDDLLGRIFADFCIGK